VVLTRPTVATIRPYDGPDAQTVIQNSTARPQPQTNHSRRTQSISVFPTPRNHSNSVSGPTSGGVRLSPPQLDMNGNATLGSNSSPVGREPSPTLPSLPTQPTLNSLINSTFGENGSPIIEENSAGPRIGDPGKRMIGAALGVRHPSLPPRAVGGSPGSLHDVQRAMGGLIVAE
jgi:hypothetical protein